MKSTFDCKRIFYAAVEQSARLLKIFNLDNFKDTRTQPIWKMSTSSVLHLFDLDDDDLDAASVRQAQQNIKYATLKKFNLFDWEFSISNQKYNHSNKSDWYKQFWRKAKVLMRQRSESWMNNSRKLFSWGVWRFSWEIFQTCPIFNDLTYIA